MSTIAETGLFNLGYDAYRARWSSPLFVRRTAVMRCLERTRKQLSAAEAACNQSEARRLQDSVARYEHAQQRIESEGALVSALMGRPNV